VKFDIKTTSEMIFRKKTKELRFKKKEKNQLKLYSRLIFFLFCQPLIAITIRDRILPNSHLAYLSL
jgi:hypothetical protein